MTQPEACRSLVSVVTPFFNTAPYLSECIESIMAQTYENWEYVLADNCSTDGSGEIAASYARRDARIRLVKETQFLDQIGNYNRALTYLSPDSGYCKMVQADDWIFPACLEEMVRVAESAPNVALVGSYSMYEKRVFHEGLPYDCHVTPGLETRRRYILEGWSLFGSPTCVMYRSSEVKARRPFFDADSPFPDTEACFELLKEGDFAFVHQVLTFNRRQVGSTWVRLLQHEPMRLLRMILTYRYGPGLFSEQEFADLAARASESYYGFLGRALIEGRPADFWGYHAKGLKWAGQSMQGTGVLLFALKDLVADATVPIRSCLLLLRAAARRVVRGWRPSPAHPGSPRSGESGPGRK